MSRRTAGKAIRDASKALREAIEAHLPSGRERACALTKMDEAEMWAERAIDGLPKETRKKAAKDGG